MARKSLLPLASRSFWAVASETLPSRFRSSRGFTRFFLGLDGVFAGLRLKSDRVDGARLFSTQGQSEIELDRRDLLAQREHLGGQVAGRSARQRWRRAPVVMGRRSQGATGKRHGHAEGAERCFQVHETVLSNRVAGFAEALLESARQTPPADRG